MRDPFLRLTLLPAALLFSGVLHAANFSDWKFRQEFSVPNPGLVKISLPATTLDSARADLADLRLIDAAGNAVPYLIDHSPPVERVRRGARSFQVKLVQNSTVMMLETGLTQPIAAVHLRTPSANFIKAVAVEGSNDGTNWQLLTTGQPIFQQLNGASQLRVELSGQHWPYLRLTVDDRGSVPIPFTGAEVEAERAELAPTETAAVEITERLENPGETRLTLNFGSAHLRISSIDLESSDPLFRRRITLLTRQTVENEIVEKPAVTGSIYRVEIPGQQASSRLSIPMDLQLPSPELLLAIRNDDSPPLRIASVRAQRRPVHLLFLAARPSAYQLLTGNDLCPAPHYDLGNQVINAKSTPLTLVQISEIQSNSDYVPPKALPQVADAGASLDVSGWKFRKSVVIQSPGIQQLELDAATIAHAQSGFSDLRLLREDRQLPFIIERTSIARRFKPEVVRADDPRRPKVSRWQLSLPFARLPLTQLACASATTLFSREIVLYEEPVDDRGTPYRQQLGNARWVRDPDHPTKTLALTIQGLPVTDRLILETDNEDNSGIELADFECTWPATRLLFKAETTQNIYLYYGNRAVSSPRYDLALVAGQMLRARKQAASAGPEETLKPSTWAERQAPGQGGWILWSALALVVMSLLALIARMIPKPTPPSEG